MPVLSAHDLKSYCLLAGFVENTAFFATADGCVYQLAEDCKTDHICDGITSAVLATDNRSVIVGSENGKVFRVSGHRTTIELADVSRQWITVIASGPQNAFAFAAGRTVWAESGKGLRKYQYERSVEGLCFAPAGLRLAAARYHGVTLLWPETAAPAVNLEWKGAHTGVVFSPDGRYIITSIHENALHGWHLADNRHLRMSGYPAKVRSVSWSSKGRWLATSGAMAAIIWPFTGKNGPMGVTPLELGMRADALVTTVACHPREDMVAIGYEDGMILLGRFQDLKEALLRGSGKSAVSHMGWDKKGNRLAFGTVGGEAGVIDITS